MRKSGYILILVSMLAVYGRGQIMQPNNSNTLVERWGANKGFLLPKVAGSPVRPDLLNRSFDDGNIVYDTVNGRILVWYNNAWQTYSPGGAAIGYPFAANRYLNGYGNFPTLNTDSTTEGSTNLFYTHARARSAISLTTTGTSGAATYNASTGVLNVPTYTLAGLGGVPTSRTITINGIALDLTTDRSWTISGGTPGGANTQIQYNNAGAFAGSSLFTWNNTTGSLNIAALNATSSSNAQLRLFHNTEANPSLLIRANPNVGAEIGTDNLAINFNVLSITVPAFNAASGAFSINAPGGSTSTTSRDLFGGASRIYARIFASSSNLLSAWQNGAGNSATVLIAEQTHNIATGQDIASQLAIRPLLLTSGGAINTANTATLYIDGANNQGINNYSLWARSGTSRFGGPVLLDGITIAQRNALTPQVGMIIFCTDCTATDGSTGVSQTYSSGQWRNHY